MSLTLQDYDKAWLSSTAKVWARQMKERLAGGDPQANAHLILNDRGSMWFCHSKHGAGQGDCLLLHIKLTSRKGFVMAYYNDMVQPGTEVWDIVQAAILEEGK